MKSQSALCRILVLLLTLASAQMVCAASPNYTVTTSSGAAIVPGTTDIGNHDDDLVTNVALPFPAFFYDQLFTSVNVSSNGNLQFNSANTRTNDCVPIDPNSNVFDVIAPGWTDLRTDGSNSEAATNGIYTSVSGTAPNRIFNIEWVARYFSDCAFVLPGGIAPQGDGGAGGTAHFEVRLYEGQRRIDFIYATLTCPLRGIGVQRDSGSQYVSVACDGTPASGTQYTFTIPQTCADVPPNMISWWRAEGNADDAQGSFNGTLIGNVTYAAGEVGQAFSFDGSGEHVDVGDVDLPSTFTIDAWINPTDLSNNPRIFSKDDATGLRSYELRATAAGYLEATVNSPSQTFYRTNTAPIVTGSLQHIVVTYDGSAVAGGKLKFYVNGVNIPAAPVLGNDAGGTPANTAVTAKIGIAGDGTFPFNGLIDEVEVFSRVLTSTEIANIYLAGPLGKCTCTPPPDNMTSWWSAEGNADDSQGPNDGTLQGGMGFAAGKVGAAFNFDGVDDYVAIPNESAYDNLTDVITIDAWVKVNAFTSPYAPIVAKGDTAWRLQRNSSSNTAAFGTSGLSNVDLNGSTSINDGNWHHVAGVFDGSNKYLYVDGVLDVSAVVTGTIAQNDFAVEIGHNSQATDRFWNGLIDEAEVIHRALSSEEIAAIYNAGSAGKCRPCIPAPAGMTDWWPGDGTAANIQGYHQGTLKNGASFSGGKVSGAFNFDGVDDYVDVGDLDLPATFTIDAWINPTTLGNQVIVSKDDANSQSSYRIHIEAGGGLLAFVHGSLGQFTTYRTGTVLTANQWQHVVVTYNGNAGDGAKMTFYVNGVSVPVSQVLDDGGGTPENNAFGTRIGIFGNDTEPFHGRIDELEIFDHELGASDIAAIYNAGSGGKCKPSGPVDREFQNISSRADVGTGDNVAIAGFIIKSNPNQVRNVRALSTKQVLIRGIGPSLTTNGVNPLPGKLEDPFLELRDFNGVLIEYNDDWMNDSLGNPDPVRTTAIQNTGLAPNNVKEAAILRDLAVGPSFTAILGGTGDTTGIGLVEVYDLEPTGDSHLGNISTRAFVDVSDNVLIGGLIVGGENPKRALVRALGPSLVPQGIPVANVLPDPALDLHDANGTIIAHNDNWMEEPDGTPNGSRAAAISATGLAPGNAVEAAILFTPAPGQYTAIVTGNGTDPNGIGSVEVYELGP